MIQYFEVQRSGRVIRMPQSEFKPGPRPVRFGRRKFLQAAGSLLFLPLATEGSYYYGKAAAGGGTCPADGSPSQPATPVPNEGGINFGHDTDRYYFGLSTWSDASARVVCKLGFALTKNTGSITGKTYRVAVYSMTGTALNAVQGAVGAGTPGVDSWSGTMVRQALGSDASLSASTNYAFVVYQDAAVDAANFANGRYDDVSALLAGNVALWNTVKAEDTSVAAGEPDIEIYFKA